MIRSPEMERMMRSAGMRAMMHGLPPEPNEGPSH